MESFDEYFNNCRLEEPHYIEHNFIIDSALNLLNIFAAHENILLSGPQLILENWHKHFRKQISLNLLNTAIGIRTLYDINEEKKFVLEDESLIFSSCESLNENNRTLREVCNKIIHAKEISFTLMKRDIIELTEDEEKEQAENSEFPEPNRCLDGTIELYGKHFSKAWNVSIIVSKYVESIFDFLKNSR